MSEAMAVVLVTVLTGEPEAVKFASMTMQAAMADAKDQGVGVMLRTIDVSFRKEDGDIYEA